MSVQERVHELLEPIVATLDVELVEVDFAGGTLRVTVDTEDGITTESLAKVNRLISPILDQHDPVPGRYTLEVSSPGLERPLKTVAHYERAVGEQVVVKLVPSAQPRRVKGRLLGVADTGAETDADADTDTDAGPVRVEIDAGEVDGVELAQPERYELPITDISSARTVFDWGPSPKPGGAKKTSKKKRSAAQGAAERGAEKTKSSVDCEVRDEQ